MKNIKINTIFILLLLLCAGFMIWYSMGTNSMKVQLKQNDNINLSISERTFADEKKTVILELDSGIGYIDIGFIEEYIQSVIEPSGLKVELIYEGDGKSDGKIAVVNNELRNQSDEIQFTSPILEIEGSLYVNIDRVKGEGKLKGVCVKGDFSEQKKSAMTYNGRIIDFVEVNSVKEAVKLAGKENLDCIAGEQNAISAYLREYGYEQQYQNQFAELFKHNVCIILPQDDSMMYSILNQCIQYADLHVLVMQAQDDWHGFTESFVSEDNYKDATALIIIIFAAVLATFFFFYQSNKNLYDELKVRMDQLIASKQELQTTFNGVSYYMAELEPDGKILDINTAFLDFVNYDCAGKYIWEVFELTEDIQKILADKMEETSMYGRETVCEIAWKRNIFETNFFPIKSKKGAVEKLLFMAKDVTGERMAERQMLQDNKMIAVGQLAAGVAHEIRNPLGIIRNYCYVLKNMKDEDVQKQAIQVIEKSVNTAGNIIENLLNFSKKSDMKMEEVHIRKHIDSVIDLNKGLMKKKQITVDVSCAEDFKATLAVESFDMIFINLVTNAIDAIVDAGHLQIDIDKKEDEFSVSVTDNGTGIEEDILDDIFNPFFTTKSTVEGNGLGLYIVYNEIQKMNGKIGVISEVGKGTTFIVTLPFNMED